jgi:hypothetical protein
MRRAGKRVKAKDGGAKLPVAKICRKSSPEGAQSHGRFPFEPPPEDSLTTC